MKVLAIIAAAALMLGLTFLLLRGYARPKGGCGACFIRALREAEGAPTESGAGDLT